MEKFSDGRSQEKLNMSPYLALSNLSGKSSAAREYACTKWLLNSTAMPTFITMFTNETGFKLGLLYSELKRAVIQ